MFPWFLPMFLWFLQMFPWFLKMFPWFLQMFLWFPQTVKNEQNRFSLKQRSEWRWFRVRRRSDSWR